MEDTESFPDEEDIRKRDREEMPLLLIAEDSPTIREAYSDYLFAKGYRVAVATNGVEALAIVQQMRPDLILMDIQMPVMDGLEAIRRLRAEPVHSKVPIIALTALVMPGDKERCLAAGADEYLAKPVHLRTIIRVIEDYLAK